MITRLQRKTYGPTLQEGIRPIVASGLAALGLIFFLVPGDVQARTSPDSFADLVEALSPSVVSISVAAAVPIVDRPGFGSPERQNPFKGTPFEDMFRDFFDNENRESRPRQPNSAIGSGFVVSEDGHIVTNGHVIEQADVITVEFHDGFRTEAAVVGSDPKTDIALIKVDVDEPLVPATFGNSDMSRVGDWVLAIGNPLGQQFSVSAGIISARGRTLVGAYDDYIQTDAAINRGNSGGPLFNLTGEVIGVNTIIMSPTGGSVGLGFAMSSNVVAPVIEQLMDYGETRRGWLGVVIQDVDTQISEALGLEDVAGALVSDVPEGPAMDAGIESGDVILAFDGKDVDDTRSLIQRVGRSEIGKSVPVTVFRDGKTMTLSVVLGRREDAERDQLVPAAYGTEEPATGTVLGMELSALDDTLRETLGLDLEQEGVAITGVDPEGEAFSKGLREGDLIAEVGQTAVRSPKDVSEQIDNSRDAGQRSVLMLVLREGTQRYIGLSIEDE
ncbi:MAG: Do family serine endopeptidase [Paracoccaceae bacterium]|nr:Do family serine endopeptidase [Paracoccaceae bacterium]